MKLTDEQINSIARGNHDGMLWKQDGGLGPALCEQAREANRLREGLEALIEQLLAEARGLNSPGETPHLELARAITADLNVKTAKRVRELLEVGRC